MNKGQDVPLVPAGTQWAAYWVKLYPARGVIPYMKKLASTLCLSLTLLIPEIALHGVEVSSRLDKIRLYLNGGEAVRSIEVSDFRSGDLIVVDGLPRGMQAQNLQARILDNAAIRLGSLRMEEVRPEELPVDPEVERLEASLRKVMRTIEDRQNDIAEAGRRSKVHASLREALLKGIEESPETNLSEQIWTSYENEVQALAEQRRLTREFEKEREQLTREKLQLEQQIMELKRKASSLNRRLVIEAIGEGSFTVEIRSQMADMGWEPVYRLDARPGRGEWELEYQARIHNQSGESWNQVPLTLMTGRPGWRTQAPELSPVYLSKPQPKEEMEAQAGMRVRSQGPAPFMVADSAAMEVVSERLTTQFSLELPDPVVIDGFETGKTVSLTRKTLPAEFWSTITPAMEETAYLYGEAVFELDWPLLPGAVTLLVDGAVSGNHHLGFINPGDSLELGFGENPAIQVEHKVLGSIARDAGLIGRVRQFQRHYEAVIKNGMPVAHKVQVKSLFPVSRDGDIRVKPIEPSGVEVDPETGRFEWERVLSPGEEATFTTRFEVETPRDWAIPQNF